MRNVLRHLASWRRARPTVEVLEGRIAPAAMAIGMNLERLSDFSPAWMFTDGFKASRPWQPEVYNAVTHTLSQDVNHTLPLLLDAHGWPVHLSQSINAQGQALYQVLDADMFIGLNGAYAGGVYTARWAGTGTLQWGGDAAVIATGLTPDGLHYARLSVTPGNLGIQMRLTTMSDADPVRDVHVWMPDYNGQSFVGQVWSPGANFSPFHPLFLERLVPFHTLRFMQLAETNTSQIQHWSDRKPWDYETQMTSPLTFQNGLAPEYMVELGNELHADVWVNVPHMAADDFIQNEANFFRARLDPGRKVYVEWSNEVWNGAPGFLANQWVRQQLALPENAGVTFAQFVARENRHTFALWSQAFAGQSDRLVRVVAGFESSPAYTASVLQAMNGEFDAISPAAYFGPTSAQTATYSATTTVDQVLADARSSMPAWLGLLHQHRLLADQYATALHRPIRLLAYEGGLALEGRNQPYQPAFVAAALDPRVYGLMHDFLDGARQTGLDLFADFQFTDRAINTPYGIYGALNRMDQPLATAPRYRALLDAAASTPSTVQPQPVLLVIANQDFFYKEYADTRAALEAAGLRVVVAAATRTLAQPHPGSGQGADGGLVMPDVAVADAHAADYSAVVFVGGWGASEYQYAFPGTYANSAYNGSTALHAVVNALIADFVHQDKYVTALCHGVSVLAWARVDGKSPLAGKQVAAYQGYAPGFTLDGALVTNRLDRWNSEINGATVFAPGAIGDPRTAADDVWVDGRIITAQNWDSATAFGWELARRVLR
jgi:putative intracellular protease/amidase